MYLARTLSAAAIASALALGPLSARAETAPTPQATSAVGPTCAAPDALMELDAAIAHTAARLTEGRSLRIVAFGSSSTEGIGASSPAHSYPSRLEAILRERFPDMDITVINRGVGGEDAREMLARLDRAVIAEHPDLVLWQVGTNAIVDEEKVPFEASLVQIGLARLKAAGLDVVLVDPQYAPMVISKRGASAMVRMLETIAQRAHVGVFHRFAIMAHWYTADHMPFAQFTARDGLHMNDWSYDCLARLLSTAIVDATSRPVAARFAMHRAKS